LVAVKPTAVVASLLCVFSIGCDLLQSALAGASASLNRISLYATAIRIVFLVRMLHPHFMRARGFAYVLDRILRH
jgi:hypothetical protein